MKSASLWLIFLLAFSVVAQPSADTTAGEIERLRLEKAKSLQPETLPWLHQQILWVRENRIPQKITYGWKGIRPRFGTLGPGSGFGVGLEYFRPNLKDERFTVRSSVTASPLQFFMMDGEFEARRIGGAGFVNVLAFHRFSPSIDFYGIGMGSGSSLANRTAYSLEENNVQLRGGWNIGPRFRFGGVGRYFTASIGPNRNQTLVSTESVYPRNALPGLQNESPYTELGGFAELIPDPRLGAAPGGTRAYIAWSRFNPRDQGGVDFTRLDAFAERNQLFLNQQRAVVLRARVFLNSPDNAHSIPFYLQPQLGGPNDLRGFAGRRFYDNNLASASAEYQWQIFSGLWLAFTDAGKAFPRWNQWSIKRVQTGYGAGLRFGAPGLGTGRFDFAWSREGSQFWIVFATF